MCILIVAVGIHQQQSKSIKNRKFHKTKYLSTVIVIHVRQKLYHNIMRYKSNITIFIVTEPNDNHFTTSGDTFMV